MRMQIVFTLAIRLAYAQTTPSPRFDVASVKISGPQSVRGSDGGPGSKDPDRYIFNSATLLDLLAIGYQVEYYQVSSKAALDRDRYDVLTKLPSGTTKPEFRAMLQNLLAERFHLKLHIISREFPGYELVIAKAGSKLKEFQAGGPSPAVKEGFPELPANRPSIAATNTMSGGYPMVRLAARQSTIPDLIKMLKPGDNLPIVDRTGLSGRYDFTLEFVRDRGAASGADAEPPPATSLFTALQQQLGLQLVQKRVPLDVLVIDSFTRQPTDN